MLNEFYVACAILTGYNRPWATGLCKQDLNALSLGKSYRSKSGRSATSETSWKVQHDDWSWANFIDCMGHHLLIKLLLRETGGWGDIVM